MVEAVVRESRGEVEIEVADRGAGIPDDLKRRLFEKFGSLEPALTPPSPAADRGRG